MMALALMFREADLPWLKLHFPVYRHAFEHVLAASDEIREAGEFLRSCGAEVIYIPFHEHWSMFLNQMIEAAEARGYQKLMRLDPDELIFGSDVPDIEALLDQHDMVCFRRVNFWYSRLRYNVGAWPDIQGRAWRLSAHPRYVGQRHEGVTNYTSTVTIENSLIYHYGDCSLTSINTRALKYYNAYQMDRGLLPVHELPADAQPGAATEVYIGAQPLDPYECGLTAPFEE